MNVNKTELPATKGFTLVHCRLLNMDHASCFTGATLIEMGAYKKEVNMISALQHLSHCLVNCIFTYPRCKKLGDQAILFKTPEK